MTGSKKYLPFCETVVSMHALWSSECSLWQQTQCHVYKNWWHLKQVITRAGVSRGGVGINMNNKGGVVLVRRTTFLKSVYKARPSFKMLLELEEFLNIEHAKFELLKVFYVLLVMNSSTCKSCYQFKKPWPHTLHHLFLAQTFDNIFEIHHFVAFLWVITKSGI